ncbi:MAG: PEP-CTERM sorting domain-containing protein [Planctomycetota bacterium]
MSRKNTRIRQSVGVLIAGFWVGQSFASPLVTETFDYTAGQNIAGQTGGTGWAAGSSWQTSVEGSPSATVVSGLDFSTLPTSGNALQLDVDNPTAVDARGFVGREFGHSVTGNTELFVSYLVRQTRDEGLPFGNGQVTTFGTNFTDAGIEATNSSNLFVQATTNGSNGFGGPEGVNVSLGKADGLGTADHVFPLDETLMVVLSFDSIGVGNFTSGLNSEAKIWILSESDYDAVLTAGLSEAALDANNQVVGIEARGVGTFGTARIDPTDLFRFSGSSTTVIFDELRIGSELDDVVLIPEPASLALIALGGVCLMSRRRER